MYYTSKNKSELESYISLVDSKEKYKEGFTWCPVMAHPNGVDFAVLKHDKYEMQSLQEMQTMSEDWNNTNI